MLITSKRYYQLWLSGRNKFPWTTQVYYRLLALKRFWCNQGIRRF